MMLRISPRRWGPEELMCAYVKKVDSVYLLVTWILSTGRRRVRDGYCCDLKKVDSVYLLVTWILSTGRRRVRDSMVRF